MDISKSEKDFGYLRGNVRTNTRLYMVCQPNMCVCIWFVSRIYTRTYGLTADYHIPNDNAEAPPSTNIGISLLGGFNTFPTSINLPSLTS